MAPEVQPRAMQLYFVDWRATLASYSHEANIKLSYKASVL